METILEKLFESVPKVRILRMFLRNLHNSFTFPEIVKRTQVEANSAKVELGKLMKIALIKKGVTTVKIKKGKKFKYKKTKVYYSNPDFDFLKELGELINKSSVASRKKILQEVKGLGGIRLAVASGIFKNDENSRTDLLLVGNNIKRGKLKIFLSRTESNLGRPLRYTLMSIEEFKYRLNMYDRFLRDILEYPHEKLINKINL